MKLEILLIFLMLLGCTNSHIKNEEAPEKTKLTSLKNKNNLPTLTHKTKFELELEQKKNNLIINRVNNDIYGHSLSKLREERDILYEKQRYMEELKIDIRKALKEMRPIINID